MAATAAAAAAFGSAHTARLRQDGAALLRVPAKESGSPTRGSRAEGGRAGPRGEPQGDDFRPLEAARFPQVALEKRSRGLLRRSAGAIPGLINPHAGGKRRDF